MKPRQEGKPLSLLIRRLISCLSSSSGQPTACFSNDRIARMHRSVYSSTAPSLEEKNERNARMELLVCTLVPSPQHITFPICTHYICTLAPGGLTVPDKEKYRAIAPT